ncbi:MAG: ribulose-phosphate 3-epimerase [Ignavibacteria bacterium RIFOXYB2_FULL_35_12]|nr:MAG: ribulose-phosphate 3-epimerase [Ignavibacteria bacterium GWC2_35_8]OGU57995.1 MAG: ribulose-phosphate 3-epimerase [Ignavibacteria bacterium GWF2_35_20]OGU90524.1 MAG: ribulose-phosphate 3-epimerase [Ignavibacteria bacterium RIFOXYC12_FULL_35_11]OGU91945.1 MAG: ribulose-phosphate 3-epimerase [Ignavibacteria bacterium RIFOXYA12_FULL_35_25]OGU95130.1 MAG: ribulose-phosphate 3-epimerase [Ignavibacteria bacterium RIFOXYB12_FULL_35_14]OGV01791.1 MAG: ribulose-phosphate 3-epimerase [Ignavibac
MAILAPSILSADLSNLAQQIRLTEMGGADWIHCDVMDGHFVPNLTFGPIVVDAVKRSTHLPVDVHLMIKDPDKLLENFVKAGANYITVHYEAAAHLNRTINRIKELGCKAGVSINPATPVQSLEDIAEYADLILLMSVNPGFGGQSFIPNVLKKIHELVELRKKLHAKFLIEIDGGIDNKTIQPALKAGIDVFVAGSSIFKADNITAATAELKNILKANG